MKKKEAEIQEAVHAQMIALDALTPSPFNAARMQVVTQESLYGLAEAMRERGQLQAIVVRDLGGGAYRIVAGERRYRAALLNGWKTIRAEIRNYATDDDEQIDTVMENLQRVDLPPLVEADGIAALRRSGQSVEDITRKLGLSASAVYCRLRLGNLSPSWRAELADPKSGHGHLSERLSWLDDLAALPHSTQDEIRIGGRLRNYIPNRGFLQGVVSRYMRKIADAPWADAQFSHDKRCKGCASRTDATGLFPEYNDSKTAQCCRPDCWDKKLTSWLSMQIADALNVGEPVALYSDSYRAVEDVLPQEHREAVADWPRYNNSDELCESREEAQDGEDCEVAELRTLHLDGPRMGQYVTMYAPANLASDRDDETDEDDAIDQPTLTPMQVACRSVLEQYLPEVSDLEFPSLHNLMRLMVWCDIDTHDFESELSDAAMIASWGDGVAEVLWPAVYGSVRDQIASAARNRWCADNIEPSECALVFDWLGLPEEAAQMLSAATQSDSEGKDDPDEED